MKSKRKVPKSDDISEVHRYKEESHTVFSQNLTVTSNDAS